MGFNSWITRNHIKQMKKVMVIGQQGEPNFLLNIEGPWKKFKDILICEGLEIFDTNCDNKFDILIANYHSKKYSELADLLLIDVKKRILILWEPYVVDSNRYRPDVLKKYGFIYAPSVHWAEKTNAAPFKWPQDVIVDENVWLNWKFRKKRFVIIQGNKFSACKGELYSLRRKVISNSKLVDLYGTNWNKGIRFDLFHWFSSVINNNLNNISFKSLYKLGKKYKNYIGAVGNKSEVLMKYQISIVIENSADFISEKLFDSVRSGCVTIYVGPDLAKYGIPKEAAFEVCPDYKELRLLMEKLSKMSDEELLRIAVLQRTSLSMVAPDWENNIVFKDLAKSILFDLNIV